MAESLFGLTGEDYWTDPWKNAERMHTEYFRGCKFGLYFDSPPSVSPLRHATIPAPVYYVAAYREACKIDLETMTKVVAIRLEDREFSIANAIVPRDKGVPLPKVGKDSTDPSSRKFNLDLQTQLRILSRPGTYRIVLLLQHQMSNVVETIVERERIRHPDPEAQKFIESHRPPALPIPPPLPPSWGLLWGANGREKPQPLGGSPAVPKEPGIGVKVDRVVVDGPRTSAVLKGSFRLPVLKRDLVQERPPGSDPMLPFQPEYGMPRPTAVLPITLVILGSHTAAETVIRMHVPTYDAIEAALKNVFATGYFAIDLLSNPDLRGTAQTFSIYSFCGEFVAGPALIATVPEDLQQIPSRKNSRP
jgi:hypothetical protein